MKVSDVHRPGDMRSKWTKRTNDKGTHERYSWCDRGFCGKLHRHHAGRRRNKIPVIGELTATVDGFLARVCMESGGIWKINCNRGARIFTSGRRGTPAGRPPDSAARGFPCSPRVPTTNTKSLHGRRRGREPLHSLILERNYGIFKPSHRCNKVGNRQSPQPIVQAPDG